MSKFVMPLLMVILLPFAIGCQHRDEEGSNLRSMRTTSLSGTALVRLASGNLVAVDCFKEAALSNSDPNSFCRGVADNRDASGTSGGNQAGRGTCGHCGNGSYANNFYDYYRSPYYSSYYVVYDPYQYQPSTFCGGLQVTVSYCNTHLGYNSPQYSNYYYNYQPWRRPNYYNSFNTYYGVDYTRYGNNWDYWFFF